MLAPEMYPEASKFIRMNLPWVGGGRDLDLYPKVGKWDTYESGRVVVLHGFGITEGFQNGVGLQELLFQFSLYTAEERNDVVNLRLNNIACLGFVLGYNKNEIGISVSAFTVMLFKL